MRSIPTPVAAAIFDFDETMIDLEAQHTEAYELLCRENGDDYDAMPESFRFGSGRRVLDDVREMRTFFRWSEPLDELMTRRQRIFDDACGRAPLQLLPGVARAVRTLQRLGIPLAITSSSVRASIVAILSRKHLADAFTLIVDGSEVVHPKPDPEAYLLTAKKLAVEAASCVVFEDSTVGVNAAKNAGMFCVAIPNRHARSPQELGRADIVIESFEDLDDAWLATWR